MTLKRFVNGVGYWLTMTAHWLCTIVGALVIILVISYLCRSCYHEHKPESSLSGSWQRADCLDCPNSMISFAWNGEYYMNGDENAIWSYEFIEPDSLILHPYICCEERYKIMKLTEDTLTVRLSESIFHGEDNGIEVEMPYGDNTRPIYTYIRMRSNSTWQ